MVSQKKNLPETKKSLAFLMKGRLIQSIRSFVYFLFQRKCEKQRTFLLDFSKDLEKNQEKVLLDILDMQKDTDYGNIHGFKDIRSVEDFRSRVPVNSYEDLRPLIEKQDATKKPVINVDNPYMYQVTSGTTGKAKLIPLLEKDIPARNALRNLQIFSLYRRRPAFLKGKIFAIVAPCVEGYTKNGTPFGSATGKTYEDASNLTKKRYLIPSTVFGIEDSTVRYRLMLQLALQEEDITYLTTANPSTFVLLIDVLNEKFDEVVSDLRNGTFIYEDALKEKEKEVIDTHIYPYPERADFLEKLKKESQTGRLRYSDIWKKIDTVSTWTGGSCSIFVEQLREEFDEHVLIHDPGYISSEFWGTFIPEPGSAYGVPSVQYNFFEFVEKQHWEEGKKKMLSITDLEEGKQYYIFVTTPYGLYRYNMSDIISTKGSFGSIPLISFVQKGDGITSITGEKLHESQVISSVKAMEKEFRLDSGFYIMLADANNSSYTLYYEGKTPKDNLSIENKNNEIVEAVERYLFENNMEYESKRKSNRLKRLRLLPLSAGTYAAYKDYCVEKRKQRREQYKVTPLQWADKVGFHFESFRWEESQGTPT